MGIETAADYGGRLKRPRLHAEAYRRGRPVSTGCFAARSGHGRRVEGHARAIAGDDAALDKKAYDFFGEKRVAFRSPRDEVAELVRQSVNAQASLRDAEVSRGESGLSASGVTRALSAHGGV